jgi:asparagine synthase (glutamine-hydrolysing)
VSGLAGFLHVRGQSMDADTLERAATRASYLAIDGTDIWRDGPVGFVRFKHATTPQAVGERQPAIDSSSGLVVCFDGRLDNRDELLRGLAIAGLDAGASDAEIVLALVAKDGDACVDALVGDYAFASWDSRRRRLFVARSPAGWRPLYWARDGDVIGVASEPPALFAGLGMTRRINEGAIAEMLSLRFTTADETLWRGVYRLPAGHAMAVEGDRVRRWLWYDGPFLELDGLGDAECVERFRDLFDQSLIAVTRSSGPVASHLSGGLDSSSIVCEANELWRAGRLESPVRAISARFPGEPHDETEFSSAVEAHLGIEAAVVGAAPFDWEAQAAWCAETLHLPLRPNTMGTAIGTFDHMEAEGVRVLLTGEGGDDFLRGSYAHWPDLLARGRFRQLVSEGLLPKDGHSLPRRLAHLTRESVAPWVSKRHAAQLARPHLDFSFAPPSWIRPEWAEAVELPDRWRADVLPTSLSSFSHRHRTTPLRMARRHVNFDNVITCAAMRGIELRHPFYDRRLVEFLLGVPGHMLLHGDSRKYILREAMRGVLPELVRERRTKANFTASFAHAVLDRLAGHSTRDLAVVQRGWMDAGVLDNTVSVFQRWRSAGGQGAWPQEHLAPVYFALAMEVWLAHAVGDDAA